MGRYGGKIALAYGRVRLERFARVILLLHALPISLLILRKKTDCFAVYIFWDNFLL